VFPVPTLLERDPMVELLRNEYGAIAALCAGLSEDEWDTPTCLPGWSVRDVLAHVIGTEAMLGGDPVPEADVSHLTHMRNPIAEANEVWVESMRGCTGPEMLVRFDDVTGRRLTALDAMTQSDFDAPSWTPAGRDETYGRFMRIRHFDCFMHEHDIRFAVGAAPRGDEDDVRSSLDEVSTGIGYIVGKRAALPGGTTVRIDLTGPAARAYLVEVGDRAALVEAIDEPATVEVSLPAMRFLRLAGGRDDGPPGPGNAAAITGDRALGEQLVANLAFTI
jgi:uncharacterized protein (TIGR03083 family)